MSKGLAIVIIPVYKELMSNYEEISFRQCLKILNKYPISIICPHSLNVEYYVHVSKDYNITLNVNYFDSAYFCNIDGYNRLMLSKFFYKTFLRYEYMLIYQLDAYVFKDELNYWCKQGWDYIGAPWFENFGSYETGKNLMTVGNGGFSLRKTRALYNMLNYKFPLKNIKYLYNKMNSFSVRTFFIFILKTFGYRNTAKYIVDRYIKMRANEDFFFSTEYVGSKIKLNIPTVDVALKFSFDRSPNYLYTLNNNTLPFGCHGWFRNNDIYTTDVREFWLNFIDMDQDI